MATKKLYLGNDYVIKRTNIQDDEGNLLDGVAARGIIAAEPNGEAVSGPLEVDGMITDGEFRVIVQGYDLTDAFGAAWDAASAAGTLPIFCYDRMVVDDQDYSDQRRVQIERDRPVEDAED